MKKENVISSYLNYLNMLLEDNGFEERFSLMEKSSSNDCSPKLSLINVFDKSKTIDIIFDDDYEATLYYLSHHDHFSLFDIEETCLNIFDLVVKILHDEILCVDHYKESDKLLASHSIHLLNGYQSINYTNNEKERLQDELIRYNNWSGKITEEMQLFAIGSLFTDLYEIKELEAAYNAAILHNLMPEEKIVWSGKPTKLGTILLPGKIVGIEFLIFTALCSLLFLVSWQAFVFFEGIVIFSMLLGFFIASKKSKDNEYIITEKNVIINYTALTVRYSLKDILSMKIKYPLFSKGKSLGSIKIKVNGKRLTSLNNHLYYIEDPQKVYAVLAENIQKSKESIIETNDKNAK